MKMCKVLEVSKSGFYKWRQEQNSEKRRARQAWQEELKQKIKRSYYESYGLYGSPRIHQDLKSWGYSVSERTIGKLMKEMGLSASPKEKFVVTTDSNHDQDVYPNHLNRTFDVDAPNEAWVSDITYIRTREGWLYLASVMDLFSRKIVGWSLDSTMKKELPLDALQQALLLRNPTGPLIHHSDRGSQYCADDYTKELDRHQIQISMSRKGDPYDNACIESFHATLKKELVYRHHFSTREEARKEISRYIGEFYNLRRRHSTLGYLSPVAYEKKHQASSRKTVS
ncbi:IS3 family transposase [Jeotgalibacillus sp. R-1-5s-1]|nr:IS3 family transposase [Jeotgalibacillus sp. R-1-5s-1]TFE00868.1 IS3 family transposase [Jeotgalibacillus sp. R-1-5s-1]